MHLSSEGKGASTTLCQMTRAVCENQLISKSAVREAFETNIVVHITQKNCWDDARDNFVKFSEIRTERTQLLPPRTHEEAGFLFMNTRT